MTYGEVAVSNSPKKWHLLIERPIALKLAEYGFSSAYFLSPKVCANDKWPRINFINILCAHFLYKSELSSFSLQFFGAKILAKNALVKCWWNWHLIWTCHSCCTFSVMEKTLFKPVSGQRHKALLQALSICVHWHLNN